MSIDAPSVKMQLTIGSSRPSFLGRLNLIVRLRYQHTSRCSEATEEGRKMATHEVLIQETLHASFDARAEVLRRIELSSDLPPDLKPAIKDFIEGAWDQLIDAAQNAITVDFPSAIAEYGDLILEIIRSVVG
jgi:hypothetical protein